MLLSFGLFLAAAPFAKDPLPRFIPFIAIYESLLVFNDLVTAMLLFGVYRVFRNGAYLVLATGYLYTAGMAAVHALTFPGLFSETGLLGAGEQSTAWLYMFWHGGFPSAVMAYSVLKGRRQSREDLPATGRPVFVAVFVTILLVLLCAYAATALEEHLPRIMRGDRYTGEMPLVVRTVWSLSLAALAFLFIRRPHSVLDLWLMVVLSAWLFDIALAAVLNQGRYDFGFYAGRVYGLLAVSFVLFVLLSENIKLQSRLLEARRDAEQASRSKDLFLALVSHELRGPLTSLKAAMYVITRLAARDLALQEAAALVERQVANLTRLVNDLADVGRAARGKLEINKSRFDLAQLVREVLDSHSASGRLQDHRVGVHVIPAHINADRQRIEQVVFNLLANALKYTPAGRRIDIAVRPEERNAVFIVSDEGIGMGPEVVARAFEWFYQSARSLDRAQGGLGIGLALVRTLVELHGGEVEIQSAEGRGTCVTVSLPVEEPASAAAGEGQLA